MDEQVLTFGILTVSDTCYNKEKMDTSGPRLEADIKSHFPSSRIWFKKIVPDELNIIEDTLNSWCLDQVSVILTTGGTGCSPRDVTPEATRNVIEREVPGVAQAIIAKSLAITDMAMLSRLVCGIKSRTLIVNLPGSAKAASECFGFVKSVLPHAVALITDQNNVITRDHSKLDEEKIAYQHRHCSPSKVQVDCAAARDRKSPYSLIEVDEAVDILLKQCSPTSETEVVPIEHALNRILAEDVFSVTPLPPFRASIKDGYAVIAEAGTGRRTVCDAVAAGDRPASQLLDYNEVVRINTGAPIPEWADAVVQVEDTELLTVSEDGKQEIEININVEPDKGQDIREIGSDIPANSKVLEIYEILLGGTIGVLATVGRKTVEVFKRNTIGVISTGNELRSHHEELQAGQIHDSNKLTVINLLKQYNYDSDDCGIARDEPNSLKSTFTKALKDHDIIITTGGVSMGEFDFVKKVLIEDFGAVIHFGRINMKPGKPTTFATLQFENRRKMIFALPGNPVSACVTSLLFVIPALRYLERRPVYRFPIVYATLPPIQNNDIRPSYVRAEVKYADGGFCAEPRGNQISSRINSLIGANGLVLLPANYKKYSNLETFRTMLIGEILN